jgi:hypothetical protein
MTGFTAEEYRLAERVALSENNNLTAAIYAGKAEELENPQVPEEDKRLAEKLRTAFNGTNAPFDDWAEANKEGWISALAKAKEILVPETTRWASLEDVPEGINEADGYRCNRNHSQYGWFHTGYGFEGSDVSYYRLSSDAPYTLHRQ